MNTVLITGASQGIGFAIAKLFAKDNYSLILVARDKENLKKAADGLRSEFNCTVETIAIDLSRYDAANEIVNQLKNEKTDVDILVNNAGFGTYGEFVHANLENQRAQIQVNIMTLTLLTRLLLEPMVKRGHGKILNVASTAAFLPGPLMAVYYATKAYVLSFTQALSEELKGTGVTVTVLCPGPTKTGFSQRAGISSTRLFDKSRNIMKAQDVALAGYKGLMSGKRMVIPGLFNRIGVTAVGFVPKVITLKVMKYLQKSQTNA